MLVPRATDRTHDGLYTHTTHNPLGHAEVMAMAGDGDLNIDSLLRKLEDAEAKDAQVSFFRGDSPPRHEHIINKSPALFAHTHNSGNQATQIGSTMVCAEPAY